jgi:hypothetical protein
MSLANLSTGELQAQTLDALRKFHEVATFPGGNLPKHTTARAVWELSWVTRERMACQILQEWDRRLPLMKKEVRVGPLAEGRTP